AAPTGVPSVCPLPGNELPMPAQQRVRRRDRGDLSQGRTAEPECTQGQSSAIVISDVAAARRQWRETLPLRDARQYVFVDESGVTTDLLRRYARSLRGTRIGDHTPCSHWQTHTVVAALRSTELTAPAVFDGPIDNATFRAYVEQV